MLKTKIPASHAERRKQLNQRDPEGAFLLPAHPEFVRNHDVFHSYRQDSNMVYLTAFEEPESWALILPKGRFYLFVREKNAEREIWDGERYGVEGAKEIFSPTEAYPIHKFESVIPQLLDGVKRLYFPLGRNEEDDKKVLQILQAYKSSKGRSGMGLLPIHDPVEVIGEMRLFKSAEEINLMAQAGVISAKAHVEAMKKVRPGMNEGEVEALLNHEFRRGGCRRNGYDSIVAGGKNACVLHYHSNNEVLRDGELLLIDAGGEYEHYSADITRTFPVGKRFSSEQAQIYDVVLKAQKAALAEVKVGNLVSDYHNRAIEVLVEGLLSIGLLSGDAKKIIADASYRRFYPHGTGHWLGMDVHDSGLYRIDDQSRKLEAGMVLTVEPGLYCQPGDQECPEKFRGIGVRIEDDVVVTAKGPQILTDGVPKERAEIEALKAQSP